MLEHAQRTSLQTSDVSTWHDVWMGILVKNSSPLGTIRGRLAPLSALALKNTSNRHLVGGWATPLKNISQLGVGNIILNIWENQTCSKAPTKHVQRWFRHWNLMIHWKLTGNIVMTYTVIAKHNKQLSKTQWGLIHSTMRINSCSDICHIPYKIQW